VIFKPDGTVPCLPIMPYRYPSRRIPGTIPQNSSVASIVPTSVDGSNPGSIQEQIHLTIMALLEHLSHDAILSDYKDLLTLFLLAYHLRDDSGNITRVSAIPPHISSIQWCLRASAVREILNRAPIYDGNTYRYPIPYLFFSHTAPHVMAEHTKPMQSI